MPAPDPIDRPPPPPARPAESHKGTFGTVIVVGGSPAMIGAPAICAAAALRTGAGLVKLATPPTILPPALTIEPGATGILLEGSLEDELAAIDQADPSQTGVLALGPGLGTSEAAGARVHALLQGPRPVVLDADGLNLLATLDAPRPRSEPDAAPELVMTPHPGEFERLARPLEITHSPTALDQRPAAAVELARAHRAVVLLKGRHTLVTDGERLFRNATGNPALATAGSGDVLTGIIASLIAQGMPPFDAACLGAHVHGLAADRWAHRHGPAGLAALELTRELPDALQALRTQDGSRG